MSINLNLFLFIAIRVILIVSGFIIFGVSFFHGPDLNIGLFTGLLIMVMAVIPYKENRFNLNIFAALTLPITIFLYSYLIKVIFLDVAVNKPIGISDVVYVIPLLCLIYLLIIFVKRITKGKLKGPE